MWASNVSTTSAWAVWLNRLVCTLLLGQWEAAQQQLQCHERVSAHHESLNTSNSSRKAVVVSRRVISRRLFIYSHRIIYIDVFALKGKWSPTSLHRKWKSDATSRSWTQHIALGDSDWIQLPSMNSTAWQAHGLDDAGWAHAMIIVQWWRPPQVAVRSSVPLRVASAPLLSKILQHFPTLTSRYF